MKILKWFAISIGFLLFIYFGLIEGNEGATNVAIFIGWLTAIISLLLCSDIAIKNSIEEKSKRPTPLYIDLIFDILVTIIFAWHSYVEKGIKNNVT